MDGVESVWKKSRHIFSSISVIPVIAYFSNKSNSMLYMRLWKFQNDKTGLYSSKIDQDTAKNVKIQILENDSFS